MIGRKRYSVMDPEYLLAKIMVQTKRNRVQKKLKNRIKKTKNSNSNMKQNNCSPVNILTSWNIARAS